MGHTDHWSEAIRRSSSPPALNENYEWDRFNPQAYYRHNYRDLRPDDREILEITRDHFAATTPAGPVTGIDVGAGPNLYPALSMLPFCSQIDLYEYSASNVEWLCSQVAQYDRSWDMFWGVLDDNPEYSRITAPRQRLAEIGNVVHGNAFDLPEHKWGMGTMFFVAESLTEDMAEFRLAVSKFAKALSPGAPFAAAFMKDSDGYDVDGTRFPAVAINTSHVAQCFLDIGIDVRTTEVTFEHPLREGYGGMFVATGRMSTVD
ncbi:MAG: SCO2525 family SAM-dependent methyltransferase [Stackebrandtia sp.]